MCTSQGLCINSINKEMQGEGIHLKYENKRMTPCQMSKKRTARKKGEDSDGTNQPMEWRGEKNNNSTDRQQVFSCGLWHRVHVGPGGVSAPQACVHSSAYTLASGQFQQTYLCDTVGIGAASVSYRRRNWRKGGGGPKREGGGREE